MDRLQRLRVHRDEAVPHPSRGTAALTIGVVSGVVLFLYLVRNALIPFVFAGVIAFVATPAIDWAVARTRLPRWIFALLTLVLVLGFFAVIAGLGIPSLLGQLSDTGSNLQASIASLFKELIGSRTINLFGEALNADMIAKNIVDGVAGLLGTHAFTIVSYSFASMIGLILSFVLLGYMLFGGPSTGEGVFWLVPPARRDFARRVWEKLSPVLRRYFVGLFLVVVYASIAAYIGLGLILGIDHAAFLALLTGVLEVIPIVGPVASGTIAGLVAIQQAKEPWSIVAYIIYAVALRISIDQFFAPIVLGRAAYLSPIVVIFCFLAGGVLFGVVGVIMAAPAALAVKALLGEAYHEDGLREA